MKQECLLRKMGEGIVRWWSLVGVRKQDVQAYEDEQDEQGGKNAKFHDGVKSGFDRADGRLDDFDVEIQ
jgi:hypothetical protein